MDNDGTTLFSDFLSALEVPHTAGYSDGKFEGMSFKSLFGLSRLLLSYGIPNEAYRLSDRGELGSLPVPFVAQLGGGFVVVKDVSPSGVTVVRSGVEQKLTTDDFRNRWSGVVMLAYPEAGSAEPDYGLHRRIEIAERSKGFVLVAAVAFIVISLFWCNGLWEHWSLWLLALLDGAGIYVTYLLLLKSMNRKSAAAEKFCGVIQTGGCNDVLASPSAKFFGLFGWSEVGFAYFGVSLACLLLFPSMVKWLALVNACCCPFSFWSVWYQKYRAKAWCTLCLTVQALLWLSLFTFIGGGWFRGLWPLGYDLFILGAVYVAMLLGLNRVIQVMTKE